MKKITINNNEISAHYHIWDRNLSQKWPHVGLSKSHCCLWENFYWWHSKFPVHSQVKCTIPQATPYMEPTAVKITNFSFWMSSFLCFLRRLSVAFLQWMNTSPLGQSSMASAPLRLQPPHLKALWKCHIQLNATSVAVF